MRDELGIHLAVHESSDNRRAWVVDSNDFSDILIICRYNIIYQDNREKVNKNSNEKNS